MKELSQLARILNDETDALNDVIQKLEQQLAESKLGVSVWLRNAVLDESAPSTRGDVRHLYSEGYVLGYTKIGDAWRIAVKKVGCTTMLDNDREVEREDYEDLGDPMALVKAPRIVRVHAAPRLEQLVSTLATVARDHIASIQAAKKLTE